MKIFHDYLKMSPSGRFYKQGFSSNYNTRHLHSSKMRKTHSMANMDMMNLNTYNMTPQTPCTFDYSPQSSP